MLDGKGLASVMREAYRGGGVIVAEKDGAIAIKTGYIAVRYPMKMLPRKCLGLIAEWVGEIPVGAAYKVQKKSDAQKMIMDTELEFWRQYDRRCERAGYGIQRTHLTMDGLDIWQARNSGTVVGVDPSLTRIIDPDFLPTAMTTENPAEGLYWMDADSGKGYALVMPCNRGENSREKWEYLDGFSWIGD